MIGRHANIIVAANLESCGFRPVLYALLVCVTSMPLAAGPNGGVLYRLVSVKRDSSRAASPLGNSLRRNL